MADIFQDLWNADENKFTVATRVSTGGLRIENADIVIDKQTTASGKRLVDLATDPLFTSVKEERLALPTYQSFLALLDNYIANTQTDEVETDAEHQEENRFLNAVTETEVFRMALGYVNRVLGETLTPKSFQAALRTIWFDMYTNHFGGKSVDFASGFEHVFVGEAKYNARFGRKETLGEISGYHNWLKFFLDESRGRVNFLGMKFDLRGDEGKSNPDVVTLQMISNITDTSGKVVAQVFKKKGGFFVGPSPECQLVMGAVAYFESRHGLLGNDRRRTTINGGNYDLVLYRSTTPAGERGDHIRSFYPEYLGDLDRSDEPMMDRPVVVPASPSGGRLSIVRALVNPAGDDEGNEWVEIENRGAQSIDLRGWELQDQAGRPEPLSGELGAQEIRRIPVRRTQVNGMQLGNKGGAIVLFDGQRMVSSVSYRKAPSGHVIKF